MKIVILEDNAERRAVMADCLADRFHQYEARFFADAAEMIAFLETNLTDTIVLSLDHDLELQPTAAGRCLDPGTGRDVADFLARQQPVCPVIIATTNGAAALGMEAVLRDARWQTHRVLPMDDTEWIPREWFRAVRRAIVGSATVERPLERPTPGKRA
jgi:CheY-like chemotaxis protein